MIRSLSLAAGLHSGPWSLSWSIWPARWILGRQAAWLLFGFYTCFSSYHGTARADLYLLHQRTPPSHGKPVYTQYSVTGIPGDGRCLFRAISHGICLRNSEEGELSEDRQREMADDLRSKVVDELVNRREETEWFIEGDFDTYVEGMKEPHVWGGEPELLMASRVLKVPIITYMLEKASNGIISIAEYGEEFGMDNPIRLLYHGFGHYDALHLPDVETLSIL